MTILSRLRAWLRPYPDAAEMQRNVIRVTRAHQAWIVTHRDLVRLLNAGRASFLSAEDYVEIFDRLCDRMNSAANSPKDFK